MNYSKLFEPGKIGKLTLKNRFIVGAMGVGFAELGGTPTDRTHHRGHPRTGQRVLHPV